MSTAEGDKLAFAACYLLLLPLFLGPLLVTELLPGLDLPFHLSMVDMLDKQGHPQSPYAPYYQGTPGLAPYFLYYLALWGFAKLFALTVAHKIVIGIYVAGFPLAVASLLGACGRSRIPALLAFPLAYNLTLHYGFVNFAISMPVTFWFLAELSRFLLAPGVELGRWVRTALVGVLLFLSHLQNFLYGLCAALAFLALSGVAWRRRLYGLLSFGPAMAALAFWQARSAFEGDPLQHRKSLSFAYSALKWSRLADLDGGRRPISDDVKRRLLELPGHVLRGFTDLVDVRACQTLLALVAFYFVLALAARRPALVPGERSRMRLACWVAFGGALLAYLALPHHLPAFEIVTFYPRFATLVVAMMLLLIPAGLKSYGGGLRVLVPLPVLVFCALYGRELIKHYRMYAAEVADFVEVVQKLPPGGRTLGLVFDRQSKVMRIESALLGLPNFYPALRPGPTSMVPVHFCGMRHIPCRHRARIEAVPLHWPWDPALLQPDKAIPFFDNFLVRSPPPPAQVFGDRLDDVILVGSAGTWRAYRRNARPPAAAR